MKNAWGSQNESNLEQYTVFANQKGVIVLFRKYASLFFILVNILDGWRSISNKSIIGPLPTD